MGSVEEEEGSVEVEGRRVLPVCCICVFLTKKSLERRKEEGLKKRGEERDAVFPICCICVFLPKRAWRGGRGGGVEVERGGEGCCVATSWLREAARERGQQPRQVLRLTWTVGRGN